MWPFAACPLAVNDFIEIYPNALTAAQCRSIIERFEASPSLQPGRVGSGVNTALKDSRDLTSASMRTGVMSKNCSTTR